MSEHVSFCVHLPLSLPTNDLAASSAGRRREEWPLWLEGTGHRQQLACVCLSYDSSRMATGLIIMNNYLCDRLSLALIVSWADRAHWRRAFCVGG